MNLQSSPHNLSYKSFAPRHRTILHTLIATHLMLVRRLSPILLQLQ